MNPEDRLNQLAAPNPTGPRYDRPAKDIPPSSWTGPGAIVPATVLAVTEGLDGFVLYVSARRCLADGTGVSGPVLYLKCTAPDREPPILIRVGFKNLAGGHVIGYVPCRQGEVLDGHGISGQVIAFAGLQGGLLAVDFEMPPVGYFWAAVTDAALAPVYEMTSLAGGLVVQAKEQNGNTGVGLGTLAMVFPQTDPGAPEAYAFEYGGGSPPAMENSFDFIEIWPALVVTADDPITARVWIPRFNFDFPPAVGDNWDLTPADSAVDVTFDKVGGGTFTDHTLLPALSDYDEYAEPPVEDWIQVRCQPGAFAAEDAAKPIPPDGLIVTFFGTLADKPLPFTFTFEWEVAPDRWKRLYCSRTIDAGDDFKVTLEGVGGAGTVKVRTGAWEVTLAAPPPAGALMRVRYVLLSECRWSWVVVPQTIEGGIEADDPVEDNDGWLGLDPDRRQCHGLPQQALYFVVADMDGLIRIYFDARGHVCGRAVFLGEETGWQWQPAAIYTLDPPDLPE